MYQGIPQNLGGTSIQSIQSPYAGTVGADPTGVTDSAAAIRSALSYNGIVYAPPGIYRIKSTVTFSRNGTVLMGAGPGATIFKIDDSAGNIGHGFECIDFADCGIVNATISAYATRSANYAVHIKGGDSSVVIATTQMSANNFQLDVNMDSQYNGVLIDDSAAKGCWGSLIGNGSRRALWRDFAAGGTPIMINSPGGATHAVTNIFCCNPTATVLGGPAINVKGTGDLRVHAFDALGFVNGFLLNNTAAIATPGTGGGVSHIMISDSQFDNTGQAAGADCIRIVPSNFAQPCEISISNCWLGTGQNGLYVAGLDGSNPQWQVSFDGGTIAGQANRGVWGHTSASGTAVKLGSTIKYYSNSAGNTLFD